MRLTSHDDHIHILDLQTDANKALCDIIDTGVQEDAFYVLDVGDLVHKHNQWKLNFPRVQPFYAVKCNDSSTVLEVLAALGTGFDCASKEEINKVLSLDVDPRRIIFANPAKPASHIRHAAAVSVHTMTFDNKAELNKIKALHPAARLVIRIRCDASSAQCQLGMKFGCDAASDAPKLLAQARWLGLEVIGVSFHVGSGCNDPPVFRKAIATARQLFDLGKELGFNMTLLDIGGGYPGNSGSSVAKIADIVNLALDDFFPLVEGVEVIAEPGRYYVASAYTLATNIHSKRETDGHTMYYINDGVYGSFNCILYDHAIVSCRTLNINKTCGKLVQSSVWGPTCDGLDQVMDNVLLPQLDIGDWLIFDNMGAYTLPVASPFNGFPVPKVHAVVQEHVWLELKSCLPLEIWDHFSVVGLAPQMESCSSEEETGGLEWASDTAAVWRDFSPPFLYDYMQNEPVLAE